MFRSNTHQVDQIKHKHMQANTKTKNPNICMQILRHTVELFRAAVDISVQYKPRRG